MACPTFTLSTTLADKNTYTPTDTSPIVDVYAKADFLPTHAGSANAGSGCVMQIDLENTADSSVIPSTSAGSAVLTIDKT